MTVNLGMPTLLFVYGTLMRGYDHPMARMLAVHANWHGPATCRGRLYRIGTYPGLFLSNDPAEIVHGDLYALRDDALLAALDDYEGCGASDPPPHPYARRMIEVTCGESGTIQAWTYVYLLPVDEDRRIGNGRFSDNLPTRRPSAGGAP